MQGNSSAALPKNIVEKVILPVKWTRLGPAVRPHRVGAGQGRQDMDGAGKACDEGPGRRHAGASNLQSVWKGLLLEPT
jgi:hypothetical protein